MRDTGRPGGWRFKPERQAATSGQLDPKSKKRAAPKKGGSHNTTPPDASSPVRKSDNPVSPDRATKKLLFEDEATPSKSADPATSGQLGPKSRDKIGAASTTLLHPAQNGKI